MKKTGFVVLMLTSFSVFGGSAVVRWTDPTTNVDGTAIPTTGPGSLVSSRVRWGTCLAGNLFGEQLGSVTVAAPATSAEVAPLSPGLYCFSVFSKNTYNVESESSLVVSKLVEEPNLAPTLAQPGTQYTVRGTTVSLQLLGQDSNGDALTYSAVGVPPGISLSTAGLFTGIPTTVGSYTVVATVEDPAGLNDSKSFTWNVTNPPQPNPPVVTVETFAYQLSTKKLNRIVGSVPLNTPCSSTVSLRFNGKNYYQVPNTSVTTNTRIKAFMVACA